MLGKAGVASSAIALAIAAAAPAQASNARIRVRPSRGTPLTTFSVRFTAPDRAGNTAGTRRVYEISVSGPAASTGCLSTGDWSIRKARAHARVRVNLNPVTMGGKWCTGTFRGTIDEIRTPVCPEGEVCPALVLLARVVGHFQFRVHPAAGSDTSAPKFGGLISARACTPGPQRPGQTTPFTLSWNKASDNDTPSDKIVYEVFESSTAGGENYSRPTWMTGAGVTSFRTPGLPSHGTFYFVVRARDQAGNVDRNTVERLGSDPCV